MIASQFTHVQTWVFDLDNTLYHPSAGLFEQMNPKMTRYIMRVAGVEQERANELRHEYWRTHGSTLAGLMHDHGMDPHDFLRDVHEIDVSHLTADPDLGDAIKRLPGRKIVYTNGTAVYAKRVIAARGLTAQFDAVYGVEHANFRPKPEPAAFERVFGIDGVDPMVSAMFEDEARNLTVPHAMGMKTVHVSDTAAPDVHIHHHTDNLTAFLSQLV